MLKDHYKIVKKRSLKFVYIYNKMGAKRNWNWLILQAFQKNFAKTFPLRPKTCILEVDM